MGSALFSSQQDAIICGVRKVETLSSNNLRVMNILTWNFLFSKMYSHFKPFLYNMTVSLIQYIVTWQLHMAIIGDGLHRYVCTTLSVSCSLFPFHLKLPCGKCYVAVVVVWTCLGDLAVNEPVTYRIAWVLKISSRIRCLGFTIEYPSYNQIIHFLT